MLQNGLMYRTGRCRLCELPHCVEDAQPDRNAGKVAIVRQLFGSSGAFHHSRVAEPLEHKAGDTPDVDFRDHAGKTKWRKSTYG